MPDDYNSDQAIAAAAAKAIGDIGNYAAQTSINKKTRAYNERMYAKQREDALADWNRVNEYNMPGAQMDRLKAAGLNPNLVYGHGATTDSGAVRSSSVNAWNPSVPQVPAGGALDKYYDSKIRQAQYDNLLAQNTVLQNEALLKMAQTHATAASESETRQDLATKARTSDFTVETAFQNMGKIGAEARLLANQEIMSGQMVDFNMQFILGRLRSMALDQAKDQAQINQINQAVINMKNSGVLQQIQINLENKGIQKTDPVYLRVLTQLYNNIIGNTTQGVPIPDNQINK